MSRPVDHPVAQPVDEPAAAASGRLSHAIFRVARLHKELAGRLLREVGLHPGQELLLMQLWDGGPQRQVDVLRILGSDAATITRSVRRLERAGLVQRSANPDDRRSVIIEATPASHALRDKVAQVWVALEQATVADMSDAEQSAALVVLQNLEGHLSRPQVWVEQHAERAD